MVLPSASPGFPGLRAGVVPILRPVLLATGCVAGVTVAKVGTDSWFGEGTPWIMYLAGVMISARYGGRWSGLAATALSILVCAALFLAPEGPFSIHSANERFRLALFLAEGVLISVLLGSLRAARLAAERAHDEMILAYDASIEGWARILDLRDGETEGHSRRVAELSVRVARALGLDEAELVHMRRGALLHDIGKMGIPDAILHKPGPLNNGERAVMQAHPRLAHEWLSPLPFLGRALEIPYCHHERWDGTGYPRGLQRDEIPLSARIFAAVDIWDALRSDRPYREAWDEGRVREHLRSLSGTYLDPAIVIALLAFLDEDKRAGRGPRGGTASPDPAASDGGIPRIGPESSGESLVQTEPIGPI